MRLSLLFLAILAMGSIASAKDLADKYPSYQNSKPLEAIDEEAYAKAEAFTIEAMVIDGATIKEAGLALKDEMAVAYRNGNQDTVRLIVLGKPRPDLISLKLEKANLLEAVEAICEKGDCTWRIRNGIVLIDTMSR